MRKALLPVGSQQDSWHLLARLLGAPDPARTPPPRRAKLKAPLSFHFLSAGHDGAHAVCVTGRINRATTWVPLEKTQSIRRVQGPLQRPLGLATVHVDVAGKRARAQFRDREVVEADHLVEELSELSRVARMRHERSPTSPDGTRWSRSFRLVPRPLGTTRTSLLARRSLDRARGRWRAADLRGAYADAVKRIGKCSMERMDGV